MIRIFIGYDKREAVVYHACCQSIIETATEPVSFHPLASNLLNSFDGQRDGTNAFTYSRYLVPYLCGFEGNAIFLDGDMAVNVDIQQLWELRPLEAVSVVHHDYKTKHWRKYIGSTMESPNAHYARKNWSSVMLWNCAHPANAWLTPENVAKAETSFLHRFSWLKDDDITSLPEDWNYLVGEYPPASPALHHFTLGAPGLKHYADDHGSWKWHGALVRALQCAGETPSEMVKRSEERVGAIQ